MYVFTIEMKVFYIVTQLKKIGLIIASEILILKIMLMPQVILMIKI